MGRKTLHLIGNAHIDPVWLWTAEEGRQEVIETCRSALDRMRGTEDFVFCRSSAATYLWLERFAPRIFREVRRRVQEGRWVPVGGWWEQPDCNIPSGEALVRQGLVGKAYFRDRLGIDVTVGYNVDTFGHPGSLPQILKGMGMDSYVFFRPGPHEKALPGGVFAWEGPDGSRVLAARPPGHYNTGPEEIEARVREAADAIEPGLNDGMAFYGVGNHGGGPTKRNIASILALRKCPDLPQLVFSDPGAFFDAIRGAKGDLPVVRDELQYHSRGCYTSVSAIKGANRRAEDGLLGAEVWSCVAQALVGREAERGKLGELWRTVLFNQFHDILAGTSIRAACEETVRQNGLVIGLANEMTLDCGRRVASQVDTGAEGEGLVVFNPVGWDRAEVVEAEVNWRRGAEGVRVEDEEGREAPSQVVRSAWSGGGRSAQFLVEARIGATGYACLRVKPAGAPGGRAVRGPGKTIENGLLRVRLGEGAAWIAAVRDLEEGVEVVGPGCAGLVVLRDESDTWSHGVERFREEMGRFEVRGEPEVVAWGPLRWTIRQHGAWGASGAWQEFSLTRGRKAIDVRLEVDWHEKHRMLKLSVPTRVRGGEATYEIPHGAIVRPASGDEEPAQRWVDLSGRARTGGRGEVAYGVSLLNDCKYGFDILGGEIRMSVLRSPIYAFHDPAQVVPGEQYEYTDQGRHVVRYAIVPHRDTWREAGIVRRAAELNRPCFALHEPAHAGGLPVRYSLVRTDRDNVDIEAVKPAEAGEGIAIRLRETAGVPTECRVTLAETHVVELGFRGWEIKTLVARRRGRRWVVRETNLLERAIGRGR